MSVGDRYLRLHERLGAVVAYLVIVAICVPITLPVAGVGHLIVVLLALHVAAAMGKRIARAWGERRSRAVAADPARLDADAMGRVARWSDPQDLVQAIASLPAPAQARWLEVAGDLPHRCGTTVRGEVERQGLQSIDDGTIACAGLVARLEWTTRRRSVRALAMTPSAIWVVITVVSLARWPLSGDSFFFGLVTAFCTIGLVGMVGYGFVDERAGHRLAGTPDPVVGDGGARTSPAASGHRGRPLRRSGAS